MLLRLVIIASLCVGLAGCGGDKDAPPSGGGGGEPPTVRSGDRLGWDQMAPSAQVVQSYTFNLYVDGVRRVMNNVTCAPSSVVFVCSGTLPSIPAGRRTLELTAVNNGIESDRSATYVVTVVAGSLSSESEAPAAESPARVETLCVSGTGRCYQGTLIAADVNEVTAVASTPIDQFFLIEDGRRVRVIEGRRLFEEPALSAGADTRFLAAAIPPDYASSRYVFVASRSSRGSARDATLDVTRYRELQGSLAEGASIVSGLPIRADGAAQMAIDSSGRLYLSVSGAVSANALGDQGSVLRFRVDGTVPVDNRHGAPLIAHGYADPSALIWDGDDSRLWLAGTDVRRRSPLATIAAEPAAHSAWPGSPVDIAIGLRMLSSTSAARLAMTGGNGQPRSLWLISAPGVIYRAPVAADVSELTFEPVSFGAVTDVTMIAGTGSDESLLLIAASQPGRTSSIWRLDPPPSSR